MVKVAAIQISASADMERNLGKAAQYLEAAAHRGVRIACFPELFCHPWFPRDGGSAGAERAPALDGDQVDAFLALSRRTGVAAVYPYCERADEGVYHNSALVVDAHGRRVGLYRKVHLPQLRQWEEKRWFAPGNLGFPVFEVEGLRLGVQLGWDNFFPEGFRCLALAGAQAVFLPTAAAFASQERWLAMAVSHAVANGLYVVRVNRVGSEDGLDFYGESFAVRPDGELTAEPIGRGEGVLLLDCDPAEADRARVTWPYLRDRRPRQYARVAGIDWGPELLPPDPSTGARAPDSDPPAGR
ncbi:MAG: carbon-nitrogen hydrolase family protein [Deferrisomatales bacterium]